MNMAEREPDPRMTKSGFRVRRTWPIFACRKRRNCRRELRREWLWWVDRILFHHGVIEYEYLCSNCAPTHEIAIDLFDEPQAAPEELAMGPVRNPNLNSLNSDCQSETISAAMH